MSEIVLNQPRIRVLVGQSEAAGVAQHVGMGEQGQGSGLAVIPQEQIDGRAVQGLAPLADKERLHARSNLPPGAVFQRKSPNLERDGDRSHNYARSSPEIERRVRSDRSARCRHFAFPANPMHWEMGKDWAVTARSPPIRSANLPSHTPPPCLLFLT